MSTLLVQGKDKASVFLGHDDLHGIRSFLHKFARTTRSTQDLVRLSPYVSSAHSARVPSVFSRFVHHRVDILDLYVGMH